MYNDSVWLVAANMGYGHIRAIFPFKYQLSEQIILMGENDNSSPKEKKAWQFTLNSYEFLSRAGEFRIVGKALLGMLNKVTGIPPQFPEKDRSKPAYQVKTLYNLFHTRDVCKGLLSLIENNNKPILTSFYAPAIAVSEWANEEVFCIICDADINRVWVQANPSKNRIIYFSPCRSASNRLRQYGISNTHIIETGFPLPLELAENSSAMKNFNRRMSKFTRKLNRVGLEQYFAYDASEAEKPLVITYAVGGAGAQKEIGGEIAQSLHQGLKENRYILNLVAGIRPEVHHYFVKVKERFPSDNLHILFATDFETYYNQFNALLAETDILWTKPSELSFYSALGLPVIASPPIGAQEYYNLRWLKESGCAIIQEKPLLTHQWLSDFIERGIFARAALNGYIFGKRTATQDIIKRTSKVEATKKSVPNFNPSPL